MKVEEVVEISAREIPWTNGGSCTFLLGFVKRNQENKETLLQKFGAWSETFHLWEEFWESSPEKLPIGLVVFSPSNDPRASRAVGVRDKGALLSAGAGARLLLEFGQGLSSEWEDIRGKKLKISASCMKKNREGTPASYGSQDLRSVKWEPVTQNG